MFDIINHVTANSFIDTWLLTVFTLVNEGFILGKLYHLNGFRILTFGIAILLIKLYSLCMITRYKKSELPEWIATVALKLGLVYQTCDLLFILGKSFEPLPPWCI